MLYFEFHSGKFSVQTKKAIYSDTGVSTIPTLVAHGNTFLRLTQKKYFDSVILIYKLVVLRVNFKIKFLCPVISLTSNL